MSLHNRCCLGRAPGKPTTALWLSGSPASTFVLTRGGRENWSPAVICILKHLNTVCSPAWHFVFSSRSLHPTPSKIATTLGPPLLLLIFAEDWCGHPKPSSLLTKGLCTWLPLGFLRMADEPVLSPRKVKIRVRRGPVWRNHSHWLQDTFTFRGRDCPAKSLISFPYQTIALLAAF